MAGPTMQPPGVYEAELIASTAQRMAEEIRDVRAGLEQAQARIAELETQAAALREALKLATKAIGTAEHIIMQCMDGHYDVLEHYRLDSQVAAYRAVSEEEG